MLFCGKQAFHDDITEADLRGLSELKDRGFQGSEKILIPSPKITRV